MGVNPDPAKVTWPVPCWTTMQLNPSGKPVGIVKVTAVALVKLMTVPLSDAVNVYAEAFVLILAPNPDNLELVEEPPVKFPVVDTFPVV